MAIWDSKKFARINWKNRPSTATALGATNLNKIDVFCNEVDNALIQFDAQKLNIATANSMIASLTINEDTGLITAKQLDGTTYTWDLNIEKIPVSFTLSEDGVITMTTEDGTQWTCNIAELIKNYVFDDSSTIAFTKQFVEEDEDGKGAYHVTASIKNGSVNEQHLDPDYRADILAYKTQAQQAANDALTYSKDSKRWAVGDSSYEGSDVDNSKYYKEQAEAAKTAAEQARDEAQAATGNVIMAPGTLGVGKPDGTTVDTSADGTISAKTVEAGDDIEESGSSLKTAWLNLKDGLLKRFAWSHVKVIFYDYAESKLLSAKLDEMDQVSGDLSGLTTTAKGSLVSAVNEVDGNIGDLSGLTTTAKTNLVAAVNELNNKTNLKYTEGTGCNVFYNNSVVFIHLNVSGITAANDEIITKIVLPDGISVKLYRPVWILANLMGSNWIPTNEAIYLSFGDTHTLKSPAFRVKSGSVSNATIAGTYVFPRDLFDIT